MLTSKGEFIPLKNPIIGSINDLTSFLNEPCDGGKEFPIKVMSREVETLMLFPKPAEEIAF